MPQVDNIFSAFWMDTTTAPGTPLTSLSATITIREVDTGTVVVNAEAMTNLGGGWYKYVFTAMASDKDYVYICNPGATAYIESGVTDKRLNSIDANISDIRGGGGFSVNLSGVTTSIGNLGKRIDDSKNEIIQKVESSKTEILESEKLDNKPILDKIDSIEIPETIIEEKEAKKANKLLTTLTKDLKAYVESEMKEKEEIQALSREFTKQELEHQKMMKEKEMEDMKKEEEERKKEEEERKKEGEEDAKLLEEIKAEFDKQDEMDKEEKKKELEKELEETLKEAEDIKKELKTL